jgi:hypothetical protein
MLPRLLGPAIAWAEMQSQHAERDGQCLSASSLALARSVGVMRPELIRTSVVDELPIPAEPLLRQAALETGLLRPGMIGLTLGYSIFVVRGHMGRRLLSHECRHVYQYEVYGSIAAFLPVYLEQIVTVGYHDAAFEQDARAHEVDA